MTDMAGEKGVDRWRIDLKKKKTYFTKRQDLIFEILDGTFMNKHAVV